MGLDVSEDLIWLAAIGGLFRSDDGGDTWSSTPVASSGSFNVLFADVVADGDDVWAVAQLADSMLPNSFSGLITGTVFHSADRGKTWSDASSDLGVTAPMAIELLQGRPCVASIDGGVSCLDAGSWRRRGERFDAVGLDVSRGVLAAGRASGGLRVWDGAGWQDRETAPIVSLGDGVAVDWDGRKYTLGPYPATPTNPVVPGVVSIALSFHVNLAHSYRGDSNDDEGYGQDLRVIGRILEWLEEHPEAKADWDIENHFSLDGWLATDGANLRQHIADRVAAERDDVRIMSWNNGAVASETRREFDASIRRAQDSYAEVFATSVPGVQPQENMITPEHIGWYRDLGVDWVTLFYSATGFTGLRSFVELTGPELHNPVTLRDPAESRTMTWVPAYHHADVLDHGGLASWVRQIRATTDTDTLLLIHFDGDAESWENFDRELDVLQPLLDEGAARHVTIQEYLDEHEPVGSVDLVGDIADGTGDGFQSWAEKDINHRLFTRIAQAREWAARAELLGAGASDVEGLIDDALEPRLLALSTTHFGLAAPYLVADRVEAAWMHADTALAAALDAWAASELLQPLSPGEIQLVNPRSSGGPSLVHFELSVPSPTFSGLQGVAIRDGGAEVPARVSLVSDDGATVILAVSTVVTVPAQSLKELTWQVGASGDRAHGGLSEDSAPESLPLLLPFTECSGVGSWGMQIGEETGGVDSRGVVTMRSAEIGLNLCGEGGLIRRESQRWSGLPGTVLEVEGTLPNVDVPTQVESVALSPLACTGFADTLRWRTFGDSLRTRPVLAGVDTWNGQSIDGHASLNCSNGASIDVSHRALQRTSIAFLPFRERDGVAMVAPLGTLWGSDPWHDGRRTGGSGVGEVVASMVGSQFRPAAPDWAGQSHAYTLLVGEGIDPQVLDLFAHPPAVRVGPSP